MTLHDFLWGRLVPVPVALVNARRPGHGDPQRAGGAAIAYQGNAAAAAVPTAARLIQLRIATPHVSSERTLLSQVNADEPCRTSHPESVARNLVSPFVRRCWHGPDTSVNIGLNKFALALRFAARSLKTRTVHIRKQTSLGALLRGSDLPILGGRGGSHRAGSWRVRSAAASHPRAGRFAQGDDQFSRARHAARMASGIVGRPWRRYPLLRRERLEGVRLDASVPGSGGGTLRVRLLGPGDRSLRSCLNLSLRCSVRPDGR